MESETTAAIVISIIALLVSIMLCGYLYVNQPETTDLSGVESDIISMDKEITNLGKDIDKIDTDCECDVDQDDLDDLEDDLEEYCRDEVEDECDCDIDKDDFNELNTLVDNIKNCAINSNEIRHPSFKVCVTAL